MSEIIKTEYGGYVQRRTKKKTDTEKGLIIVGLLLLVIGWIMVKYHLETLVEKIILGSIMVFYLGICVGFWMKSRETIK